MPTSSIFSDLQKTKQTKKKKKTCGSILVRATLLVPEQAADTEYKKLDER